MRTNFNSVKKAIGVTDFHDNVIGVWYDEAYTFCKEAGVSESYLQSESAVGLLAKGVLDLWDFGSGTGKLSEYFKMRVVQARGNKDE
jgi:hypothetical protein